MKLQISANIISAVKKEGKNGLYQSLILMQDGEVIEAYTKNMEIVPEYEFPQILDVEIKKYKGVYSSIRVI